MFPYQIYQALTDQRLRDLMAEARRQELVAEAMHARRDLTAPSSRLRDAAAHLLALLHVRDGARDRSAQVAGAGPIGCAA
ncbi:MAG TPA: hypothetical protein VF391_04360 [Dermatophilaceae bacterium]|jgi:hypothetical protein